MKEGTDFVEKKRGEKLGLGSRGKVLAGRGWGGGPGKRRGREGYEGMGTVRSYNR